MPAFIVTLRGKKMRRMESGEKRERKREREIKRESWKEMNERVKEKRNGREKGRKFFSRSKVSFHVICRALESR